jgi:opacity protein-like surface antigen
MKKLATLLCAVAVVAVAGMASAQSADQPQQPAAAAKQAPAPAAPAAEKSKTIDAEVVSADATAKTLTIKGDPNKTLTVDASAVGSLKDLKSGDKVKITCRQNDMGETQAVTKITKEMK